MNTIVIFTPLFLVAAFAGTGSSLSTWISLAHKVNRRELSSCDVDHCLEPVRYLEHPTTGLKLVGLDNEEALDHVCKQFVEMRNCVEIATEDCEEDLPVLKSVDVQTLSGLGDYICNEGKEILLEEASCWNDTSLESAIEQCSDNVLTKEYEEEDSHCRLLDDFTDCTVGVTYDLCNEDAATFMDSIVYYSMEPLATLVLECEVSHRYARDLKRVMRKLFRK